MGCFSQGLNSFHQANVLFVLSQIAVSKNAFQNIMLKYESFRHTVKYEISPCTSKIIIRNFYFFFPSSIRMSGKNVNFGDKIIKKSNFYKNKRVIKIDDIVVNKILVSKEEPCGTKNSFKWYNDNDVIRLLCIKLLQMIEYVRKFEGNTTMSFKISNKQFLKKYNQI